MRDRRRLPAVVLLALAIAPGVLARAPEPPPWEATPAGPEPEAVRQPAAPEWGGADAIWIQIPPTAFFPSSSTTSYATDSTGRGRRWPTNLGGYFQAPLDLPQGAKITNLGIFYLDNNTTFSVFGQLVDCEYTGTPCVTYPTNGLGNPDCLANGWVCSGDANAGTFGSGIYANLSASDIVVNNYSHRYSVNFYVPASDGSQKIGGAIVGYRLQVSPAPLTATFSDVPTSHPYFRFIEALAASGITGGCTPAPNPSYCPDAPITRGQMAVFLAAALGLHWVPVIQ
jgi:hypothetical protein